MTRSAFDPDHARMVLQDVLGRPGGGHTVIQQFSALPGAGFAPGEPKRLLRPARASRLTLGDQAFSVPGSQLGTQVEVSHVVREVALQTRRLGPADAALAFVNGLIQLIAAGGPDAVDAVDAALYGLELAGG